MYVRKVTVITASRDGANQDECYYSISVIAASVGKGLSLLVLAGGVKGRC